MSGEHNEGEHGMQPALIFCDDDKDSCGAVAAEEKKGRHIRCLNTTRASLRSRGI